MFHAVCSPPTFRPKPWLYFSSFQRMFLWKHSCFFKHIIRAFIGSYTDKSRETITSTAGNGEESFRIFASGALPVNAATSTALHYHNYSPQQWSVYEQIFKNGFINFIYNALCSTLPRGSAELEFYSQFYASEKFRFEFFLVETNFIGAEKYYAYFG